MTRTEEYIACRRKNMTYQAIGDMYGVSKQAVHSGINKYGLHIKQTTVTFHGLRKWMCEHHMFVTDLEKKLGMPLRTALRTGRLTSEKIDALLRLTGLTYEEAFGKKEV